MKKKIFKRLLWIAIISLLVLIILFLVIQKKHVKELKADRIALVDVMENNYIFRGNNPFVIAEDKNVFAYEKVKTILNQLLQANNHQSLQDFYLLDISLLDLNQYNTIKIEEKFFDENSEKGMVINVPTFSLAILLSNSDATFITDDYNAKITEILKQIHNKISQKNTKPTIIYIHCDGGRDRTGFIIAAYRMLFKNMPLQQAIQKNQSEVGRNSEWPYRDATESYCRYLQKNYAKPDSFCNN